MDTRREERVSVPLLFRETIECAVNEQKTHTAVSALIAFVDFNIGCREEIRTLSLRSFIKNLINLNTLINLEFFNHL